jgi:hypothetical protein
MCICATFDISVFTAKRVREAVRSHVNLVIVARSGKLPLLNCWRTMAELHHSVFAQRETFTLFARHRFRGGLARANQALSEPTRAAQDDRSHPPTPGATMRIALIHALKHSIAPIEASFARLWPEAELANLLDDRLSADLARDGALTPAMTDRFLTLAHYAVACGADGVLFTCSAFGPCIDACASELAPMPVLKPNEAMIDEAVALAGPAGRIGLLATFAPTLATMPAEFAAVAPNVTLVPALAADALAALNRGDTAEHDRIAAEASRALESCDVVALAQFSLSSAAKHVAAATGRTVLTTPDSAVRKLQRLLAA